jgi:hypothetical protein
MVENKVMEMVRQVLVPMFYKESQIGRSLNRGKRKFKKALFDSIAKLRKKADNGTLRNVDIRREIKKLSQKTKKSIGQSQKVINVYLKYYCVLTGKPLKIIRELDCPLDSRILSKFESRKLRLKSLEDFKVYKKIQKNIEKEGKGIRLMPDIKIYDERRI